MNPKPPNTLRNLGGADLPPRTLETVEGAALDRVKSHVLSLVQTTVGFGNPCGSEMKKDSEKVSQAIISLTPGLACRCKNNNLTLALQMYGMGRIMCIPNFFGIINKVNRHH